jgi:hypothetical protein
VRSRRRTTRIDRVRHAGDEISSTERGTQGPAGISVIRRDWKLARFAIEHPVAEMIQEEWTRGILESRMPVSEPSLTIAQLMDSTNEFLVSSAATATMNKAGNRALESKLATRRVVTRIHNAHNQRACFAKRQRCERLMLDVPQVEIFRSTGITDIMVADAASKPTDRQNHCQSVKIFGRD